MDSKFPGIVVIAAVLAIPIVEPGHDCSVAELARCALPGPHDQEQQDVNPVGPPQKMTVTASAIVALTGRINAVAGMRGSITAEV
jgi:hypothetical protein